MRANDTSKEVAAMVRERLLAMSGEERFIRGALMFDAAREMVLASLDASLSVDERNRLLYERIYGEPFPVP